MGYSLLLCRIYLALWCSHIHEYQFYNYLMSYLWILVHCAVILCCFSSLYSTTTIKQSPSNSLKQQPSGNITDNRDLLRLKLSKGHSRQMRNFNYTGKSRTRRSFVRPVISMLNPQCGKKFRARAVAVYRGSGLKLTCDPCGYVRKYAVWTKLPLQSFFQREDSLDVSQEVIIPPTGIDGPNGVGAFYGEDMSLGIRRTMPSDAGVYQCKVKPPINIPFNIGIRPLSYYYVEVKPEPFLQEFSLDEGEQPPRNRVIDHDGTATMVYTVWSTWGSCSSCDVPGRRRRLGYCYAFLLDNVFSGGVPCQSSLVPQDVASTLRLVKDIQLETSCMEYCTRMNAPAANGQEPLTGLFIHGGGNSYHSIDNQKKGLQTLRVEEASALPLECPEAYVEDAVTWRRAGHIMQIPIEDLNEGDSRIFMDPEGTLIFRKLRLNDTNGYECHVNQRRTANYRVYVFEQIIDKEETFEAFGVLSILVAVYTVIFLVLLLGKYCLRQMVMQEMETLEEDRPLLDEDDDAGEEIINGENNDT